MEMINWVEDEGNGLRITQSQGEIDLTLQFQPIDYMIVKKLKRQQLDEKSISEERKLVEGYQYYLLTFSCDTYAGDFLKAYSKNQQAYNDNIYHLSYGIQNDFVLVDGQDTLPCAFHHFERTYNLSPDKQLILSFKDNSYVPGETPAYSSMNDKTIIYDDQLFNLGTVSMKIEKENLKKLPELKST